MYRRVTKLRGVLALIVCLWPELARCQTFRLTEESDPPGIIQSETTHAGGNPVFTKQAIERTNDLRFFEWRIRGAATGVIGNRDGLGRTFNPVPFNIVDDTVATAVYLNVSADVNTNAVPDWWERQFFTNLVASSTADVDMDGLGLRDEFLRDGHPALMETNINGGIAVGYSPARTVSLSTNTVTLTVDSSPSGFIPPRLIVTNSNVTVHLPDPFSVVDGRQFAYWRLNGLIQTDQVGRALGELRVNLQSNSAAVAVFLPADEDMDGDGVPDWFEWHHSSSLLATGSSNSDLDHFDFLREFRRDSHPGISDTILEGGLSFGFSPPASVLTGTNLAFFTRRTIPEDLVPSEILVTNIGTSIVVPEAPAQIAGNRFAYWTLNGVTETDFTGVAVGSFSFSLLSNSVAEALYFPIDEDLDVDIVPDWFEQHNFQTLDRPASADDDADGLTLIQEYLRESNPRLIDTFREGGTSIGWSSGTTVLLSTNFVRLSILGEPEGIVVPMEIYPMAGDSFLVSEAPDLVDGLRFAYWEVNGVVQTDLVGRALGGFSLSLQENAIARAFYLPDDQDLDMDAVPDWFERQFAPDLLRPPAANVESDAFTFLDEFRRDYHPSVADVVRNGGVSFGFSSATTVNLRGFPSVRTILVDGFPEEFFGGSPPHVGTYAPGTNTAPAFGDWDGDRDLDLFVGSGSEMNVFENRGSIVVLNLVDVSTNFDGIASAWANKTNLAPALGDWNKDGISDFAVGGSGDSLVHIVSSTTNFLAPQAPAVVYTLNTGQVNPIPSFVNVNGNDLLDLLILNGAGFVHAYTNTGSATTPYIAPALTGDLLNRSVPDAVGIDTADVNGDGMPDLLVSDRFGSIYEFHRQESGAFLLRSRVFAGSYVGFADRFAAAVKDIDGDGDQDVVGGFAQGGLVYLRNDEPKLLIDPPSITLVSGQSQQFSEFESTGAVSWSFFDLRSGGNLQTTSGLYSAGITSSVIDTIEGVRDNGLKGRAHVNVISTNDVTAAGKAIIVAGGRALDDPVWTATDHIADFAYRALRFRGYATNTLQYHSFGPGNDVDGNGLLDDIDAGTSFTSVESTFGNWVGNTPKLFVYLADHGSAVAGRGEMRLNASETLPAATLDGWFDAIQDAHGTEVTLVMDFCYAGSFLDELSYTGVAQRIVISSTATNELTYFVAGGVVSFSDVFFNGLFQGFDLKTSFELARQAMSPYQSAAFDDNKNGLYEPGIDGPVSSQTRVGASVVVGRDFPTINRVIASQMVESNSLVVWAADVSSVYPLERVWATITPPSNDPDVEAGVPVVDIPDVDLIFNPATLRYEAQVTGLSEPGLYSLLFFAQDIWGGVSLPKSATLDRTGFKEQLVLVACGPTSDANWSGISNIANTAYATFQSRQFKDTEIIYLNPVPGQDLNGDGTNDVDDIPAVGTLADVITNQAAGANRLTIHIVGSGTNDQLVLDTGETLSPSMLDGWLDVYQVSNREAYVICDFSGAGTFIEPLTADSNRTRIVVASSPAERRSLLEPSLSFSSFLLNEIFNGRSLGDGVVTARKVTRRASGNIRQKALIDDTGDGIPNTKNADGLLAKARFIGPAFVTGEDIPNIGEVIPAQTLSNTTTLVLWADEVTDADGIAGVWCEVTPPTNYLGSASVRLDLAETNSRWEVAYDGFTQPGQYVTTFFAQDITGDLSAGVQTEILQTDTNIYTLGADVLPDLFEPDGTFTNATYSDLSAIQVHTLDTSNDCDTVRFFAVSNFVYDIETVHLGTNPTIDTVIEIYREEASFFDDPSTQPVLIDTVDEFGRDEGELAGLDFPTNGIYYVRVCQAADPAYQPGSYLLIIYIPAGPEGITVHTWDVVAEGPLSGVSVEVTGQGAGSGITDDDGTIRFPNLTEGNYFVDVTVSQSGSHGPSYVPLFDPSNSQNIFSESSSDYGNPRELGDHEFGSISYNGLDLSQSFSVLQFGFIPVAYVEAQLTDAISGEPVTNMQLRITRQDASNTVFRKYPWAEYGELMASGEGGSFERSAPILPQSDYTYYKILDTDGRYLSVESNLTLSAPAAGEALDLGAFWLEPKYGANQIPNAWEYDQGIPAANYGLDGSVDSDLDGRSNLQEYLADTHPLDPDSVFGVNMPPGQEQGEFVLRWEAAPRRIYQIHRTTNMVSATTWNLVHAITNLQNDAELSWKDPESAARPDATYRIGVTGIEPVVP